MFIKNSSEGSTVISVWSYKWWWWSNFNMKRGFSIAQKPG
jgi:hypothetical protein